MPRASSKRKGTEHPEVVDVPPEIERLKRQQKNDVNQCMALELAQNGDASRERGNKEMVGGAFKHHTQVRGEELVDKTAVC